MVFVIMDFFILDVDSMIIVSEMLLDLIVDLIDYLVWMCEEVMEDKGSWLIGWDDVFIDVEKVYRKWYCCL